MYILIYIYRRAHTQTAGLERARGPLRRAEAPHICDTSSGMSPKATSTCTGMRP